MKQEALAFFTDIHLTNLGLILFMVAFIGCWRGSPRRLKKTLRPHGKPSFKQRILNC